MLLSVLIRKSLLVLFLLLFAFLISCAWQRNLKIVCVRLRGLWLKIVLFMENDYEIELYCLVFDPRVGRGQF